MKHTSANKREKVKPIKTTVDEMPREENVFLQFCSFHLPYLMEIDSIEYSSVYTTSR